MPYFEGGVIMGLLDMFGKGKAELLELQKIVLDNSPDELILSKKKLIELARIHAENSLRIVHDCNNILQNTTKPDVFFERFQLMILHSSNLVILEKYIPFSGASPTDAFHVLMSEKQECINQFLIRYFCAVFDKAEKMKTDKGKLNQYQKFYDSLVPYFDEMDADNIDYVETKYRAYTRRLKA